MAVLIPTHHGPEVKQVDFIDFTTTARLSPSKDDCPVLVHHGKGEATTGRSLSSELRGRPDTWKWGWGNLENGTMLHHPYNDMKVNMVSYVSEGGTPPTSS